MTPEEATRGVEAQIRERAEISNYRLGGSNAHEIKISWFLRAWLKAFFA
jgi:hypothetical protein